MLTTREAFKAGFLLRCAEEGLSGPAAADRMRKAAGLLDKQGLFGLPSAGDAASAAGGLGNLAMTAGIAAPVLAGAGAGYLAHRATSTDVDEEDVRKRELIEELRHYTRRAREQQKRRTLRPF